MFPIEVRKHKCYHKSSTCLKPACTMQQSSPQLRFFLNLVPIDDHLINKTRFHHQGLPNVGVCKVVARSLLVKQSGFLAPLPPLTAPTLFVALLTGSSLAAECEKLGCAIIIGGADQESKRLPTWGVVVGGNDSDEIIVVASSQLGPARDHRGSRKLATL